MRPEQLHTVPKFPNIEETPRFWARGAERMCVFSLADDSLGGGRDSSYACSTCLRRPRFGQSTLRSLEPRRASPHYNFVTSNNRNSLSINMEAAWDEMVGVASASFSPLLGADRQGFSDSESWGSQAGDRLCFVRSCDKRNYDIGRARYLTGWAADFSASCGGAETRKNLDHRNETCDSLAATRRKQIRRLLRRLVRPWVLCRSQDLPLALGMSGFDRFWVD